MTRDQAVARIQQGLGFRTDRATQIQAALIEAQRDLEKGKTLPKFMLAEDQPLTLTVGTNSVALPSDFLKRDRSVPITYTPTGSQWSREIPWRDYEHARMAYRRYSPCAPRVAALRKSTIYFAPVADRTYSLTWNYFKRAAALITNIENDWLADNNSPEYLIGAAGLIIATDMRNQNAIAAFTSMMAKARVALFSDIVESQADDYITMGGDN